VGGSVFADVEIEHALGCYLFHLSLRAQSARSIERSRGGTCVGVAVVVARSVHPDLHVVAAVVWSLWWLALDRSMRGHGKLTWVH
jgi:hypothetical protein